MPTHCSENSEIHKRKESNIYFAFTVQTAFQDKQIEKKWFLAKEEFQLTHKKNERIRKIIFLTCNEILDQGNNHQWILKSLGKRQMKNFITEKTSRHHLNPLTHVSTSKSGTTRHYVLPDVA